MDYKLILASASTSRLKVLKSAGITAKVLVSNTDEEKILSSMHTEKFSPKLQVSTLALAKALSIVKDICINTREKTTSEYTHHKELALVACDSMLEFNNKMLGKPKDKTIAIQRAKQMRGKTTTLHTGHALVKLEREILLNMDLDTLSLPSVSSETDVQNFLETLPLKIALNCDSTKVTFAVTKDKEIEKYVETGEPLYVAGGFTIDGYGSAFIERIDGDYNNVIGISPRVIRNLSAELDIEYTSLWDDIHK